MNIKEYIKEQRLITDGAMALIMRKNTAKIP